MPLLKVTTKNVKLVKTSDLVSRYKKLERKIGNRALTIHPDIYTEWVEEQELIRTALDTRDMTHLISEQLLLPGLEEPKKHEYKALVVQELERYFSLSKQYKRILQSVELIFPSNIAQYGELHGVAAGAESYKSKTERAVIKAEERAERAKEELAQLDNEMEPIERALESLTEQELMYIELKYFNDKKLMVVDLMVEMDVKKSRFHDIQKQAYIKIAESLKIL